MIKKMIGLVALCLVVGGTYDLARTQSFQGPTTPTSLLITLDDALIATDARRTYSSIMSGSAGIDVVKQTGLSGSMAGTGTVGNETYGALRFLYKNTSTYTGTDPCTGTAVSGADIQFPGTNKPVNVNDTQVKIDFMVPHPVTGLKPGYLEMKPLPVSSNSLELRLVFQATNSVICASSATPLRTISGMGLNQPEGIALNPINNQIVISDKFVDTVETIDSSGKSLLYSISGSNTGLDHPMGLYVDTVDTGNPELGVPNSGNSTLTFYKTTDKGNVPPIRTLGGNATLLSNPRGVALLLDPNHIAANDEIVVTNGGNNSVTIYNRQNVIANTNSVTHIANVAPVRTIIGSNTGLNAPCGIAVDGLIRVDRTSTGGNFSNTLTDTNQTFITDQFKGLTVGITGGKGQGQVRMITSNTNNTLFVSPSWTTNPDLIPDSTSSYRIVENSVGNSLYVVDNGNDSVTVYSRSDNNNVSPQRTIIGPNTGLSNSCGIYIDRIHDEIGVANSGNNTITIYDDLTASGDAAPKRTIRGSPTGLSHPIGIYIDTLNDEIGADNVGNSSLTFHNRSDTTAQLKVIPDLLIFSLQQELHPQYTYAGTISTPTGTTAQGDSKSVNFSGYKLIWGITDNRIRQPGDASGALLIPPSNVVFELTDGSLVSNLGLGCGVLTPFTHIQLSTNCSGPLILSPYPAGGGTYTINATLFKATTINTLPIASLPIKPSQVPWPVPTLTLFPIDPTTNHYNIKQIDWKFVDQAGDSLPSPLIYSQEIQITLTQPIASVSNCYTQVTGNAQTLVFNSGPLAPDVRTLPEVKNNGCDINLNDVDTIVFAYTDAMNNNFVFNWKPQ